MQAAQSVSDSDRKITPAHLQYSSAPVGSTVAGSCSPGSDLPNSLHAMSSSSRRDESPLNSLQPCTIFSSSCTAADPERGFAGAGWSPRSYACTFCGREFNSAQALGGHMNIHRRDRARLRTSTSPTPAPPQADLPPIPQNTPQSARSGLYHPFEAAFTESPPTAISASLSAYTAAPTIMSANPTFRLLEMHPAADPTLLALVAHPSQAENPAASLSARPLLDLAPFCPNRSSANRFRKAQFSESETSFPDIAPHASPLLLRPGFENTSLNHAYADALSKRARQASSRQLGLEHCSTAGGAELIQLGKRPRVDHAQDAAFISSYEAARPRVDQRCEDRSSTSISSTSEKSNPVDAATDAPRSCVQPPSNIKGSLCLDLELRLGRSSASDNSRASTAGGCSVGRTAPRQPEKSLQ